MTSHDDRGAERILRWTPLLIIPCATIFLVNCDSLVPRNSWSREWGPMVPHTSFPGDCVVCHIPETWSTLRENFDFDHEAVTGHPLRGAHMEAACLRCHNDRGPVEAYVERGCAGCHVDPHQSSLGLDCTRCHSEQVWTPEGLISDHARTRFPLFAAHAVAPCESCHQRATVGIYRDAPVECHFCHQKDALRAFPNHALNGWTRGCERCHTPAAWGTPGLQHDFFPLQGGHAGLDCTQCHVNGQFTPIPPQCIACHQNDYLAAPDHVAENRATDCTECHDIFAWD